MIRKRRRLQNNIEKKINAVTSGIGTVYRSGVAPEFTFVFCVFLCFFLLLFLEEGRAVYSLVFGVVFCSSLLALLSFFVMVISVLRRFTSSGYYFDIFKFFLPDAYTAHFNTLKTRIVS